MQDGPDVTELRLVLTAPDYDKALRLCRDVLGLRVGGVALGVSDSAAATASG